MIQTRWADCHRGWAHPIALAGAERCKAHVAEGGGGEFLYMGSSEFGWTVTAMDGH